MSEDLIGVGAGRLAFSLHWAKVIASFRDEPRYGAQWLVDVRLTTGANVEKAKVVGNRLPLVHDETHPSWGVIGYIGGNTHDPIFWPCPWTYESRAEIASHDMLDRHEVFTFHIESFRGDVSDDAPQGTDDAFGVYTIRAPGNAPPNEDNGPATRYMQIVSAKRRSGGFGKVQMLGGVRRLARGGATSGDPRGDYVAIDVTSSPAFIAWMQAVTAALATVSAGLTALAEGQAALAAQTVALQAWGATVAPPCPPLPPAPADPPAPPVAVPLPVDPVPDVDGGGGLPGDVVQVVGQIVTGSATVTGR